MGLGEGSGTPLQYSCLENAMDGGAWWVAVHGVAKSRTWLSDFTFTFHFSLSCVGEGNGNPLQCSCLENPRDSRVWWAAVYGVTQSRTRLKRLSSPVFPASFIEEAVIAPLHVVASFAKNKVPIDAWVYFWAFYLVLPVYISVFVPVAYCLDVLMTWRL